MSASTQFGWLVSYPKSGNTWVRMMLDSLSHPDKPLDINATGGSMILSYAELELHLAIEASQLLPGEVDHVRPALHRALALASAEPLLLRKVHDRCWSTASGERVFPPQSSRGAVYIVRDPRDVAVSSSHHFQRDLESSVRTLADTKAAMGRGGNGLPTQLPQPLGSWSEHVTSWLDHAAMPVLLVRYEDMLADPVRELTRIAAFLGLSELAHPESVSRAAAATTFSNLRSREEQLGFAEKSPGATRFFRRGSSGEGKQVLSPRLLQAVESDHRTVMTRLGYL